MELENWDAATYAGLDIILAQVSTTPVYIRHSSR